MPEKRSSPVQKKPEPSSMNLVIIDTAGQDKFAIKPFIDILETAGWNVTYRPIEQLMDMSLTHLNINRYQAAFFLLSIEFLKGMGRSPVAAKIMTMYHTFCKKPNAIIGLFFPPLIVPSNTNIISGFAPLFTPLGLEITQQKKLEFPILLNQEPDEKNTQSTTNNKAFTYIANSFLSQPLESRPRMYETTLNPANTHGHAFYTKEIESLLKNAHIHLHMLPLNKNYSPAVQNTLPYGLYWFNPHINNHLFISYTTILSLSSISENFHFCPIDYLIRKEMNLALLHMIWELTQLAKTTTPSNKQTSIPHIIMPQDITLPWSSSRIGEDLALTAPQDTPSTRKIAWMETTIFEPLNQEKETPESKAQQEHQQNLLIQSIIDAGLDTLWISITPNIYYSPIARHKHKKHIFLQGLGTFTQKLISACAEHKKTTPNVLVGFEIANNIYEPNLPLPCAVDLYGNSYKDVPPALDRMFWKNEVKTPLVQFLKDWSNDDVSHGIKLAGVVLDLEMYGRKTSNEFTTCMGFDRLSFTRYLNTRQLTYKPIPAHEKSSMLMEQKRTHQYFDFLEEDAKKLGLELHTFFNKHIPHAIIACYLPSILINWFYKGLYMGLSTPKKPLQLYTFNAEFVSHQEWFDQHNLAVEHASVLMLSKIKDQQDFGKINHILKHHHGIWFNRFSRLPEAKINDWGAIERPLLDYAYYQLFCNYIHNIV
ncbi:MAG: hypothetical protein US69_C0020G0009 [candidate division TM6 bacterium GW2011_GWF2_38_10]|nr:MAG: hypothetical protein US69_C0020G0009 [candidate division TM6 bacterium GW2011_GWF2_38_10]